MKNKWDWFILPIKYKDDTRWNLHVLVQINDHVSFKCFYKNDEENGRKKRGMTSPRITEQLCQQRIRRWKIFV